MRAWWRKADSNAETIKGLLPESVPPMPCIGSHPASPSVTAAPACKGGLSWVTLWERWRRCDRLRDLVCRSRICMFAGLRRCGACASGIGTVRVLQHDPRRQSDGECDCQYTQGNVHPDPAHSCDATACVGVRAPSHLHCLRCYSGLNESRREPDEKLGFADSCRLTCAMWSEAVRAVWSEAVRAA
jgi:hypothetical protein